MKKTISIIAACLMLVSCESVMDILEDLGQGGAGQEESAHQTTGTTVAKPSSEYDAKDGDGPFGSYYNYKQISIAKKHAIAENRPLLLVASMDPCAHCDNFNARVLRTKQFRQFVIDNRIVVCETRNNNLMLKLKNMHRTGYGAYYSGAPHVYLFKILSDEKTGSESFAKDQAELLKSEDLGKWFVGSYKASEDFMGIPTGAESSWNPSTFIRQIKACFPNQYFKE